jgi:hypothetical protein
MVTVNFAFVVKYKMKPSGYNHEQGEPTTTTAGFLA